MLPSPALICELFSYLCPHMLNQILGIPVWFFFLHGSYLKISFQICKRALNRYVYASGRLGGDSFFSSPERGPSRSFPLPRSQWPEFPEEGGHSAKLRNGKLSSSHRPLDNGDLVLLSTPQSSVTEDHLPPNSGNPLLRLFLREAWKAHVLLF